MWSDTARRLGKAAAAIVVTVVAVGLVILLPGAAPVAAHTELDFSTPADGESVGIPVTEITVAFTLPVTLVGNGFEVLDPQENLLEPTPVTDDDTVFRLRFEPALSGGAVGVRYAVRAEDGHELAGAFSFTVDAVPSTTRPPPTTQPPTTRPSATQPSATSTTAPPTAPDTPPPSEAEVDVAQGGEPADQAAATSPPNAEPSRPSTTSLDSTVAAGAELDSGDGPGTGTLVAIFAVIAALAAGAVVVVRSRAASAA